MRRYRFGSWTVDSELTLDNLLSQVDPCGPADLTIRVGLVPTPARSTALYDIDDIGGAVEARVWRDGTSYLLHYLGRARLRVDTTTCAITVDPNRGRSPSDTRQLVLDHVLPRLLGYLGEVVLHATCVRTPYGSAAFLGESGFGKSTLAVSFGLTGHALQADDCLIIDRSPGGPMVVPSYPRARLRGPALHSLLGRKPGRNNRYLVESARDGVEFTTEPSPLSGLFLLNDPTASPSRSVATKALNPLNAAMTMMVQSYHLDTSGPTTNRDLLERYGAVADEVPAWRLSYPRRPGSLPAVHRAVLDALAGASTSTTSSR